MVGGKKYRLVGTKKQHKDIVKAAAEAAGTPYVNRTLGWWYAYNAVTMTAQIKKLHDLERRMDLW